MLARENQLANNYGILSLRDYIALDCKHSVNDDIKLGITSFIISQKPIKLFDEVTFSMMIKVDPAR